MDKAARLRQARKASKISSILFWGQFKRSVVNVSEQVERDRALGVINPNTPVWTRERIEPSVEEAAEAGEKIIAANGDVKPLGSGQRSKVKGKREQQEPLTLSPSPLTPSSSSLIKFNQVSPSPDPWSEERPQPTMREMLAERGVKGFCKPMPKVSQAEIAAEKRKQIKPKTNIAQMSLAEINEYLTDPILRAQLTPQLIDSDYELITDELGQIIRIKLSEAQMREREAQKLEGE